MRKNMAKGMAALLSAALLVTTVGVTPGTTASAASKELSGAVKKATIYKGGPAAKKTVTLKVKKNGKNVTKKCTWTSSKKAVATVNKSGKVTAKKAGNTVISAKYAGKTYKCNVKVKKYRYATALSNLPKSVVELKKVGDTKELRVKYADSKPTTKGVRYASSDEGVATVTKSGTITARGEGTATITVTTKKNVAKKTITETVDVKVGGEEPNAEPTKGAETAAPTAEPTVDPSNNPVVTDVKSISAIITNSEITGHDNTVLAGQDATLQVKVLDSNDKPVQYDNVVLKLEPDAGFTPSGKYLENVGSKKVGDKVDSNDLLYDNAGLAVATTNADGIATFALSPKKKLNPEGKKITATDTRYVASYNYTVTDASFNKKATGVFKVGALSYRNKYADSVSILNGRAGSDYADKKYNLVPGYNAFGKSAAESSNVVGDPVEYVASQQVSTQGTDNHAVYFSTKVNLVVPGVTKELENAKNEVQTLTEKAGPYDTYANMETKVTFDEKYDLKNVEYATLKFKSLKLSKHTALDVSLRNAAGGLTFLKRYTSNTGKTEDKDFGLQIPYDKLVGNVGITLTIRSEGQVNVGTNVGFELDSIVYHYKSRAAGEAGVTEDFNKAEIKWSVVNDVTWTEEKTILDRADKGDSTGKNTLKPIAANGDVYGDSTALEVYEKDALTEIRKIADNIDIANDDKKGTEYSKYQRVAYKVPVFPYAGNAIIVCYDKSGVAYRYYTAPTKSYATKNTTIGNVNKINASGLADSNLYLISSQEADYSKDAAVVEMENAEKGLVKVNAEKSGYMFLKGTITCESGDVNLNLDDDHAAVYTSVMWNPVQNANAVAAPDRTAYVALKGQYIDLKAQLVDGNGNPVKTSGNKVRLTVAATGPNADSVTKTPADLISVTDPSGQATFRFQSDTELAYSVGIKAEETSGTYNVKLFCGANEPKGIVDLYWVNAGLMFTNQVENGTETLSNGTVGTANVELANAETWEYATEVVRKNTTAFDTVAGTLGGYWVNVFTGIVPTIGWPTNVTVDRSKEAQGIAILTGKDKDTGSVTFSLNAGTNFGKNGTVTFTNGVLTTAPYAFVGEGAAKVDEKITLKYNVGPESWLIRSVGSDTYRYGYNYYVKNTPNDQLDAEFEVYSTHGGRHPNAGESVKLTLPADSKAAFDNVTYTTKEIVRTTDANGIVKATIYLPASEEPEVGKTVPVSVTAKIDTKAAGESEIEGSATFNYYFTNPELGLRYAATGSTYKGKTVTVKFNKPIQNSVTKDSFKFYVNAAIAGGGASIDEGLKYDLDTFVVNDKTITFTLRQEINNDDVNTGLVVEYIGGKAGNATKNEVRSADGQQLVDPYLIIKVGDVNEIYDAGKAKKTAKQFLTTDGGAKQTDAATFNAAALSEANVVASRAAYNKLTADERAWVDAADLKALTDAEAKVKKAKEDVATKVAALKKSFADASVDGGYAEAKLTATEATSFGLTESNTDGIDDELMSYSAGKVTFVKTVAASKNKYDWFIVTVNDANQITASGFAVVAGADKDGNVTKNVYDVAGLGTYAAKLVSSAGTVTSEEFGAIIGAYNALVDKSGTTTVGDTKIDEEKTVAKQINKAAADVAVALIKAKLVATTTETSFNALKLADGMDIDVNEAANTLCDNSPVAVTVSKADVIGTEKGYLQDDTTNVNFDKNNGNQSKKAQLVVSSSAAGTGADADSVCTFSAELVDKTAGTIKVTVE